MATTTHEILASDNDSDEELLAPSEDEKLPPLPPPLPQENAETSGTMLSVAPTPGTRDMSPPKTASAVLRRAEERAQQIEVAHRALLAPTQSSAESALVVPPQPPPLPALSAQVEPPQSPPQPPVDIWDILASDGENESVHLVAIGSKTKAQKKRSITSPTFDSSNFETPAKKSKTSTAKKPKRSKTMPLGGEGEDDEDDFDLGFRKMKKNCETLSKHEGRMTDQNDEEAQFEGSTRRRRLRESAQKVNYYIPPPPADTSTPEASPKQSIKVIKRQNLADNVQLSSPTGSASKRFMVDLTSQVLPMQARQEYDPVFLDSPENTPFEPFVGSVLAHSSVTTQLQSTIPDSSLQQTLELPPLPSSVLDPNFVAPVIPAPPTQEVSVHTPELEPPSCGMRGKPEEKQRSLPTTKKKRAQTDMGVYDPRNAVATSWRAAKAKGRPNLADTCFESHHSDDDDFSIHSDGGKRKASKKTQKSKEKKKAPAKKGEAMRQNKRQTINLSDSENDHGTDTVKVVLDEKFTKENDSDNTSFPEQPINTINMPDANQTVTETGAISDVKHLGDTTRKEDLSPARKIQRTKSRFIEPQENDSYITAPLPESSHHADLPTKTHVEEEKKAGASPTMSSVEPPKKASSKRKRTRSSGAPAENPQADQPAEPIPDPKPKPSTKRRKTTKNQAEPEASLPPDTEETPSETATSKSDRKTPTRDTNPDSNAPNIQDPPTTPGLCATTEDKLSIRETSKTPGQQRGLHSPIKITNRQRHRVGLSRRARIEPLLKVVKKS